MAREPQKGSARHRHRILRTRKSCAADPYGVLEMSLEDFVAKWFVRTPESRGWIAAVELPDDKYSRSTR